MIPASSGAGDEVIRVLIADHHGVFRRGLFAVLDSEEGIEVIAEVDNGADAVASAEALAPDVAIMALRLPGLSGVEATRAIRLVLPSTKILMLTVSDDEDDLYEAIKAGANGYLLRTVSVGEVAAAIRSVAHGHSLISPAMVSMLLSEFRTLAQNAPAGRDVAAPMLTAREFEVLRLMAQSQSNRHIAEALFISENTVKNHVRNILEKLDLHSRMEAVLYAMRKRLLEPPA